MTYKEKLDIFTFLVPIFNLEGDRLENFKFVLSKLVETEANILVVEQVPDKRKKTIPKELCKKLNVDYLPVKVDDTYIHKSKLINIGTDHIKTEFVWVNDSDCYIKFREVINLIDFRYNFIQPYKVGKYLEEQESIKIRNNEKVNIDFSYIKDKGHHIFTGTYSYVGMFGALSFIYKKEDFYSIGKMNENYRGWGLEDNSLCRRMFEYSKLRLNILNIYAIHLYHPRNIFADKLRDYNGDTAKNIKVYEKEFNNKYTIINEELRDYYTNFFEGDKKISIIGLSRSGTTHLLTGISLGNNLICYGEFVNTYGLTTVSTDNMQKMNQPFIDKLNNNIDLEKYIDLIYQKNNICTKHVVDNNYGANVFIKDGDEFQNTCFQKIIQHSNKVLITTRFNFLDWITSHMLANHQSKWCYDQGDYTEGITKISKKRFNYLYDIWYKYHFNTLCKLKELCDKNNKNYLVVDYDDINNESFLNDRLHELGINKFTTILKKQKKKPNEKYITNYDQVKEWYSKKV